MTKPKSKPKAATRSARKTSKLKSRARSAHASSKPATGPHTKHARIIAMLRTSAGPTDKGRVYRITNGKAPSVAADRTKPAA